MQNGSLENIVSELPVNNHPEIDGPADPVGQLDFETNLVINDVSHQQNGHSQDLNNNIDEPPNKKRKLAGPETQKPLGQRPISPPWKKVAVEGPSSFVAEGRRKSSRTNFVPIELQPLSEKRQTRGAGAIQHGSPVTKSRYGGASVQHLSSSVRDSTQTLMNHNKPDPLIKATIPTPSKSPVRYSQLASNPLKLPAEAPPPAKRSHKKRIPASVLSPSLSEPLTLPDTDRPRRVGRPPGPAKNPKAERNLIGDIWHEDGSATIDKGNENESVDPASNSKPHKLSLKLRMPTRNVQHPENIVRRLEISGGNEKRYMYSSFQEWLEKSGSLGLEGEAESYVTDEQARREASLRNRITGAARPGGLLNADTCQFYRPGTYEPPPRLYTHQDRLITHATYFQKLMQQEKSKHLKAAKECAERAAALVNLRAEQSYRAWKEVQPRTDEELAQEQREAFKEIYEQLREDIKCKWLMVGEAVEQRRLQRWQDEQDRLGKEALNEAIEKSRGLLDQRRTRRLSEIGSDVDGDDEGGDDSEVSQGSESAERRENEDNMSSSESESDDDDQLPVDEDENLTQYQIQQKYGAISASGEPSPAPPFTAAARDDVKVVEMASTLQEDREHFQYRHAKQPLETASREEASHAPVETSDESTDMDDDMGTSDDSLEDQEDSSICSDEDGQPPSLLSALFSKQEIKHLEEAGSGPDATTLEAELFEDDADEVDLIPAATQGPTPSATTSEEPRFQTGEQTPLPRPDVKEPDFHEDYIPEPLPVDLSRNDPMPAHLRPPSTPSTSPTTPNHNVSLPTTPVSDHLLKVAVPSLLRGNLREYQHHGLDWLAGLYQHGTNGILADEMGLGKTIQTIALLAHLAVEHEVWGPHLIVVPTSVMLNWEMEFKKFLPGFKVLTYYGTQEERKKKRQGWQDHDKWNVWITSYTLVTHDQQVFKRKPWHYMILDEAHNIKNFQSLRWQTLLTFRTRARLLLTGTPLQNNLTELWSLLYFLMPGDSLQVAGFTSLEEFTSWFRRPVDQILEQGREIMDQAAKEAIAKLHVTLRPFLLRRLKADVEKQMPGKYEHVVYCRLSKRQRYLYDGFMSRAQTRETLASGNTFSIMNALMQLRKVCNHPDLFETRQIVTSFAMPKSAVADFEIKELLVRRRLLREDPMSAVDLNLVNLLPGANEQFSALETIQRQRLGALGALRQLTSQQWGRVDAQMDFDGSSVDSTLSHFEMNARHRRFQELRHTAYLVSLRSQRRPLYSHTLMQRLRVGASSLLQKPVPRRRDQLSEWYTNTSLALSEMALMLPARSQSLETTVAKFACVTPSVIATDLAPIALGRNGVEVVNAAHHLCPQDPFHEARMRLSIAFPDKRLLQYDCGKLQKLDALLRTLQAGGHRALIFTQMTRVLDILEQFLNIHGHRYLRLDGATKIEQRQVLTERFNNDNRILAFILSSRSGGIGINLTGADTVIFYDLDWNPAMDKQCQDRCHRIGQTRDVHIYRMVSEYTIEANILRKANQKRMLDDVVIQEGEFTTDYFNNMNVKDIVGNATFEDSNVDANAAMDRVLGGRGVDRVFEQVEDQEDIAAAKVAEKELAQTDAADFDEKGASNASGFHKASGPPTPGELMPPSTSQLRSHGDVEISTTMEAAQSGLAMSSASMREHDEAEELPSCDEYMLRFLEWELKDVPVQAATDKGKKKSKKGKEHVIRRK